MICLKSRSVTLKVLKTLRKMEKKLCNTQHFLPFPIMFSKVLFSRTVKTQDCVVNTLPDAKILDWSKLNQIADDILKCL